MNKRHYEHTLPNIRGSLSNTYKPFYKEKQIIRKGILHAASPKEETAW